MIISLSGAQGSGKSTVALKLAAKLGWSHYYIGGLRRQAAAKRGLTLAEYNKLGEIDPSTDQEVDEYQKKLGQEQDNFIIEGRTSWYFIPHSFKIYLDVKTKIGAQRILGHLQAENQRNEDHDLIDKSAVLASLERRQISDAKRYLQYYNIDVHDKNHYDFVLDTSNLNPEEVFMAVWSAVEEQLNKEKAK